MNHILLTGATGFLGSHLLEALLCQGYRVTILKRSTSDVWRIKHLLDQVSSFDVDRVPLEKAFEGPPVNAVIHTACFYGRNEQSAYKVVEANLLFGLRVLDAATLYKVDMFINSDTFFNTGTATQKYLNAYVLSKKQFLEWLVLRRDPLKIVNLKLGHVYGPKDSDDKFVSWLISQLKQNVKRISLTEGEQLRDFIYIDDVVAAYMLMLEINEKITSSELYVGNGLLVKVKDFVVELYSQYIKIFSCEGIILGFGDIALRAGEMESLDVNTIPLHSMGWRAKITLKEGIKLTIASDW